MAKPVSEDEIQPGGDSHAETPPAGTPRALATGIFLGQSVI